MGRNVFVFTVHYIPQRNFAALYTALAARRALRAF
jgi:hypothetical protein